LFWRGWRAWSPDGWFLATGFVDVLLIRRSRRPKPADVATARQFLLNQVSEHRAKLAVLDRQRAQKEAEAATASATIAKIEALIPVIQ
jgi:hypothetical protein